MRQTAVLTSPQQAHALLASLWSSCIKPMLLDGKRLVCEIKPETRTTEQNAKFHAICADLARSGLAWAGKRRTAAEWKVLLVSGHAVATKESAEVIPGLEGEFINIRESTALMSIKRGSSLIEYAVAFCAEHEVPLSEPQPVSV
jgi:hypothetical protein